MIQNAPRVIELQAGSTRLAVAPEVGGSITRYASERAGRTLEWMRPASADALAARSAGGTSSFPLVPFSNRIRDARFRFRGREVQLPRNFPPEPHAIHGHGWRAPWTVVDRAAARLTVEYRHPAGAWPWAYAAQQTFDLTDERLSVRFAVTNEATDPMPVGFGLHPYFVRTPRALVRADVGPMWEADDSVMPVRIVAPPSQILLRGAGLNPDATALDNNFTRFGGRAVIDWPEWSRAAAHRRRPRLRLPRRLHPGRPRLLLRRARHQLHRRLQPGRPRPHRRRPRRPRPGRHRRRRRDVHAGADLTRPRNVEIALGRADQRRWTIGVGVLPASPANG